MPKRTKKQDSPPEKREGGVYIGKGARVSVGADLVGRDKVSISLGGKEFDVLFTRLADAIQNHPELSTSEKKDLADKSKDLENELKKQDPDLGTLNRLKQFIASKGGAIAAAVTAVFQYPPVQQVVKTLAQRLVGG